MARFRINAIDDDFIYVTYFVSVDDLLEAGRTDVVPVAIEGGERAFDMKLIIDRPQDRKELVDYAEQLLKQANHDLMHASRDDKPAAEGVVKDAERALEAAKSSTGIRMDTPASMKADIQREVDQFEDELLNPPAPQPSKKLDKGFTDLIGKVHG